MIRAYPRDLAERVRVNWPSGGESLPPSFEVILETAYHASFLRDEERAVTCRLIVISPDDVPMDGGPPTALMPLAFVEPRAFDEHELRRLSPAAKYHRALIGIFHDGERLITWGLVQSGPRWLQAAHGGRATEPSMPSCLVVRIVRPGHIAVSCGARLVAELRGGKLTDFTLDVFQSKWLPAQFKVERSEVAVLHRAQSPHAIEDEVAADLSRLLSQQMLKRVLSTMRSAHHGGAILVGPPECVKQRFLQTKYAFRDQRPRARFRALVLSTIGAIAERIARGEGRESDVDLYDFANDPRLADLDEALFEMSHLIASLADIDGAVVLTKRFEILGFGAEITGELPQVNEVRRALDLEAATFITEGADGMGTRHRSAYRLCRALPQSLAIVVSQDGGVRFVALHNDAVTYWDHGPGDDT